MGRQRYWVNALDDPQRPTIELWDENYDPDKPPHGDFYWAHDWEPMTFAAARKVLLAYCHGEADHWRQQSVKARSLRAQDVSERLIHYSVIPRRTTPGSRTRTYLRRNQAARPVHRAAGSSQSAHSLADDPHP